MRVPILAILACLGLSGAAAAQTCAGAPTATRLDLIIDGVRADEGELTATVYPPSSSKFLKPGGEIAVWRVPAKAPMTQMCGFLPSPGSYAVVVYDDLNANHHFDHSAIAPLEPYGFSNNPRLFLGPPSVASARFAVPAGGRAIHIRLRYPAAATH